MEEDKTIKYKVDYRDIKYPRLEYKTGTLLLVLPKNYNDAASLIEKHKKWIIKKEQIIAEALEEAKKKTLNLSRTEKELKTLIHSIIKEYQQEFNLKVNSVFFRRMKTKWASYSSKGNLTINTLLKYLPEGLVRYVVFHEMIHSIEKRHNENFWKIITKKYINYEEMEKALLMYWFLIQRSNELITYSNIQNNER